MSLINQMLRDLDARKVAHGAGSGLPNEVRALPITRSSRWPIVLSLFLALLLLAVAGMFYAFPRLISDREQALLSPVPLAASPEIPSVVPQTATLVATNAGAIAPVTDSVSPVPPLVPDALTQSNETAKVDDTKAATESELQVLSGSLRMDDVLSVQEKAAKIPDSKVTPRSAPAPSERTTTIKKDEQLVQARQPELVVRGAASQAATPSHIEKTDARSSPRDVAETDYRKAILAVNQGRVEEALTGLRNVLHQDSAHSAARQLLVKLLLEARRSDEAEQTLQEGLQTQPAQIAWAMALARLQANRGDLPAAWKTLNFSLPAASGNADYQGFSGHILQRLGRHKDAIERYVDAARLSPRDGRWWLGLGLSLEAEGRDAEAKEAFQNARASGSLSAELSALVDQKLSH